MACDPHRPPQPSSLVPPGVSSPPRHQHQQLPWLARRTPRPAEILDKCQPSVVELLSPAAVIEKLACAVANPVECGAVPRSNLWPGVIVLPNELGRKTFVATRPPFFFDPENHQWPQQLELPITIPKPLLAAYGSGRMLEGEADIIWPIGTWQMHVIYRQPRRAPP
ncbi:MAG: hypothetical protein OEY14_11955 [Myxococcales bacterium]|nr:hypothetical protein [Myxococcales bacterium]